MELFTIEDIMNLDPCYDRSKVEDLWDGRPSLTLHEILDLDIPAEDRIWAWCQLVSEKQLRLFACDCAESVLSIFEDAYPNDNRPRKAIEVARLYTEGQATEEELRRAHIGAYTAYKSAHTAYSYACVAYTCVTYADVAYAAHVTGAANENQKRIEFAKERS